MNDLFLTVSVLGAVLLFGALLSIGHERQRRAIDRLAEQAAHWAEGDLRLKRASAARQALVPEATDWLQALATRVLGEASPVLSLTPWRAGDQPRALLGLCADGRRLVLTPLPPARFLPLVQTGHGRASRAEVGLLGSQPRRVPVVTCSIVNAGVFFDLEAAQVWQRLTGTPLAAERLYLFEVPAPRKPAIK